MKNVVIITQGYHSKMAACSAVLDQYVQGLKGRVKFYIITAAPLVESPKVAGPFVEIHYISDTWLRLRSVAEQRYRRGKINFWCLLILICRLRTAICLLFDDTLVFKWVEKKAYKKILQLSNDLNVDAVISVSGFHMFNHMAAIRYKKFNPQVKFVTFICDPYAYLNHKLRKLLLSNNGNKEFIRRYKMEKNIYESADCNILFESLYDDAVDKFDQPIEKTIQFRFVLDDLRAKIQSSVQRNGEDKVVRLLYAGTLYKNIRNPKYMLSVLSEVDNIHLDLYVRSGDCVDVIKDYVSDKISWDEAVDNRRYKELICYEYDILINIGNSCTNQLPSKMLELLSTGRPILNFYYYEDVQFEMIEHYPLGMNVRIDEADVCGRVQQFCNDMKGRQLSFEEVAKIYPENDLNRQLNILYRILS